MSENVTAAQFVKDLEKAKAEVNKLQQSNLSKVQSLAAFGKGIDPAVLANVKIDTFIQGFLDEGAQLVYVRNLETQLRDMLDEALKEVRQNQIIATNPKQGLILPR